ncbi:MAG: DegT/DnrJ/EryC1/StrS family aminotransferase [Erysipelotrichaceae bacterium]
MSKILVTRSSMPDKEEYFKEIEELWDTHWLTNMGIKHQELEKQLRKLMNVENISLFANGHLALELAIQAFNLSGEVITTPFTFASTTHAIVRNGLNPVFCDIDENTYTMDVTKIEKLITEKTSAIIPVHVYGNICNVEEIEKLAKKYNLKVIYDAAHAFSIKYKGLDIASFGDASMFSFHATKVFNTIEGGAIAYKESRIGKKLMELKNFGIESETEVAGVGSNAKMNEFQAAMGLCNLRHIKFEIEKRKHVFDYYNSMLYNTKGIKLPKIQDNVESNYAYYPVVIDEEEFGFTRNEVYERLLEHNIYARKYFYPLTNTFKCFDGLYDVNLTPVALSISQRVLTLPMYADLLETDVEKICRIILSMINRD